MPTDYSFHLPNPLEGFRKSIESSASDALWLTPVQQKLGLTDSKFAGKPYLPKSHLYPKDSDGQYMPLLAQFNLEQMPSLPDFPAKGLLQFFISEQFSYSREKKEERLFQQDFKVRYFPSILPESQLVDDFSFLKTSCTFPIQKEMKVDFTRGLEPVSSSDYRRKYLLHPSFSKDHVISEDGRTFEEIYNEAFLAADHKLGGYPYFIEQDTRKDSALLKKFDTLLLQIVSNDEQGIMYGDSGILKFFINKKSLREGDFSSVYFIAEQYDSFSP
ncbi:DUF1963 domain-containing protein [Lysinibacillus yapensis]|uniref:DUF1963 domain-containing protein n=1 Tax=Ureibacillus yapensis TaxID=2304605 RepID=A0A396SK98_9BACL|nr:YwqG family protein [Lysinibacillus yapensis]RHW34900.1 DUF1963 domain-containing protein [Lysinibacillus yapensis]